MAAQPPRVKAGAGMAGLHRSLQPHDEERCAAARLEAWPQAPNSPPSFEMALWASSGWRPEFGGK